MRNIAIIWTILGILALYSCKEEVEIIPGKITTLPVAAIGASQVTLHGFINETGTSGINDYGFVWSTAPSPTLESASFASLKSQNSTTRFSTRLSHLQAGTTYYTRAYAANQQGVFYGGEVSFTTTSPLVTDFHPKEAGMGEQLVITGNYFSSNITDNQVKIGGTEAFIETAASTELTVLIPENVKAGEVEVEITVGGTHVRAAEKFYFLKGAWKQKSSFPGTRRQEAIAFSRNGKGYLGLGKNPEGSETYNDFWVYDPVQDRWTQQADFPGTIRHEASSWVIGDKGYVMTGRDAAGNLVKEVWEYDFSGNSWTQKKDFTGEARAGTIGFVIGEKGYLGLGTGANELLQDIWEYDPVQDSWTQKNNFQGIARTNAATFTIDNQVYVGTGSVSGGEISDLWQYQVAADQWTSKSAIAEARTSGIGFSRSAYGYMGLGQNRTDLWQYDPAAATWLKVKSIESISAGEGAQTWELDGTVYVITTGATSNEVQEMVF